MVERHSISTNAPTRIEGGFLRDGHTDTREKERSSDSFRQTKRQNGKSVELRSTAIL